MRAARFALVWLIPLGVAACDGCDKKDGGQTSSVDATSPSSVASQSASAATSTSAAPATSGSAHAGERGFRGGLAGMLLRGAKELELDDTQKTKVNGLATSLRPTSPGEMRTEMKDLQSELAAQTKAGKLEPAKLEPKLAALEKSGQAQKDKEAEALDGLHAALQPAQRTKLVADLKAKQAQGHERRDHGDHDGGAKWAEEWTKRRLAKMTKDLDLDDAQQKKVEAILVKDAASAKAGMPDRDAMKKQMEASLDAFDKDAFDAKKLDGFANAGKKSRAFADHEVQFLSQLVPLLTPVQRDKLSTSMTSPPKRDHGPRGGGEDSLAPLLFEDDDG